MMKLLVVCLLLVVVQHITTTTSASRIQMAANVADTCAAPPASSSSSNVLQPSSQKTCCFGLECPHADGVCCANGRSCCPQGAVCLPAKLGEPQTCGVPVAIPTRRLSGNSCTYPPPPPCKSNPCAKPPCSCNPAPVVRLPPKCPCSGQPSCACSPQQPAAAPPSVCGCIGQPSCGCAPSAPPSVCGCVGQPSCGCAPSAPPAASACACQSEPSCPCDNSNNEDEHHWTYEMEGADWHGTCASGKHQSPIIINEWEAQAADNFTLETAYTEGKSCRVKNTGHGVQISADDDQCRLGSAFSDGVEYVVKQFHFHFKSEHRIGNTQFPLEMHIVHQKKGSTGTDDLLVLGQLWAKGHDCDAFLDKVHIRDWPKTANATVNASVSLNEMHAIEKGTEVFGYDGSLTTPPCSETVKWHVIVSQATVCAAQIHPFQSMYPTGTARKAFSLGARTLRLGKVKPRTVSSPPLPPPPPPPPATPAPASSTSNAPHEKEGGGGKHDNAHHFDYQDEGHNWGGLCHNGTMQSPIFIHEDEAKPDDHLRVEMQLKEAKGCRLVNNGHAMQVTASSDCQLGSVFKDGTEFEVRQFHFHTTSEHRINGETYPLEMHIVTQKKGSSGTNDLLVIGKLWALGTSCDTFLNHLNVEKWPLFAGDEGIALNTAPVNLQEVIPESPLPMWNYKGSLTTPPCSETVDWHVIMQRGTLCPIQMKSMNEAFPAGVARKPFQLGDKRVLKSGHIVLRK